MKQQFEDGEVPLSDNTAGSLYRYGMAELEPLYGREEADAMITALLEHYAAIPSSTLRASLEFRVQQSELIHIYNGIRRLKDQEPLQYITGTAHFYHSVFRVNRSVLIPRPETEELVHLVLTENRAIPGATVLDIGTGSGCIAVSLALFWPGAQVHAMDVSPEALDMAAENARTLGAGVQFHQADILKTNMLPDVPEVDILVSNPPYIRRSEATSMPVNVTAHEPHIALFVPDEDALVFYRAIARLGLTHLKPGGKIYVEIHENGGEATAQLFREAGYPRVDILPDLSGKQRFIRVLT